MYEKSVVLLNKAIADELTAVHQYMYFHFHLDDQGFDLLAGLFKKTAIEEMLHIEEYAERVLFLKGEVELVASGEVSKITDVRKMLEMARSMEEAAIKDYNNFALECANHADSVTKKLFEDIVVEEERHYDRFDTEIDNLERFGSDYLALQSIERSKSIASGTSEE